MKTVPISEGFHINGFMSMKPGHMEVQVVHSGSEFVIASTVLPDAEALDLLSKLGSHGEVEYRLAEEVVYGREYAVIMHNGDEDTAKWEENWAMVTAHSDGLLENESYLFSKLPFFTHIDYTPSEWEYLTVLTGGQVWPAY